MDWSDLKVVLALARGGSIAAAARTLAIDGSTVSRRLAAIEATCGTQLLIRGGREFAWTEPGRVMVAAAEQVEAVVLRAATAIETGLHQPVGLVRVSCPTGMAMILSRLQAMADERHPGLIIEVAGKIAAVDLARNEADLAIRMFKPPELDVIARPLSKVGWIVCCSEAYRARHGTPATPAELALHTLVLYDPSMHGAAGAAWIEARRGPATAFVRFDSTDAAAHAVASGRGIGAVPNMTIAERDHVVRVFPGPMASNTAWLVFHESRRDHARVRAAAALITDFFAANQPLFTGEPG